MGSYFFMFGGFSSTDGDVNMGGPSFAFGKGPKACKPPAIPRPKLMCRSISSSPLAVGNGAYGVTKCFDKAWTCCQYEQVDNLKLWNQASLGSKNHGVAPKEAAPMCLTGRPWT